jgi:hypothetical protein
MNPGLFRYNRTGPNRSWLATSEICMCLHHRLRQIEGCRNGIPARSQKYVLAYSVPPLSLYKEFKHVLLAREGCQLARPSSPKKKLHYSFNPWIPIACMHMWRSCIVVMLHVPSRSHIHPCMQACIQYVQYVWSYIPLINSKEVIYY